MSEQGLRDEIKKLVRERDQLLADLAAERGTAAVGEIVVRRYGTDSTDPTTFHVRLSINIVDAHRVGNEYLEYMLDRMRAVVKHQVEKRYSCPVDPAKALEPGRLPG